MKKNIVFIFLSVFICFSVFFYSTSKIKKNTKIYVLSKNSCFSENILSLKNDDITKVEDLKNLKNAKYIVLCDKYSKQVKKYPKKKLFLFLFAPPNKNSLLYNKKYHKHFSKVYTTCDELIDNKKYFKFYFPIELKQKKELIEFEDKKFCLALFEKEINQNLKDAISYFQKINPKDLDVQKNPNLLSNYKFSLCYEKVQKKGYITKKIFTSFAMGSIPIYLGADNIKDYIPQNCFIDKENFKSYNELYIFLKTMTKEEYQSYINNINDFLAKIDNTPFTKTSFTKNLKQALDLK